MKRFYEFYHIIKEANESQIWAVDSYDYEGRHVTGTTLYHDKGVAEAQKSNWTRVRPVNVTGKYHPGQPVWKIMQYGYGDMFDRGNASYFADREEAARVGGKWEQPQETKVFNSAEEAKKFHAGENERYKNDELNRVAKEKSEYPNIVKKILASFKEKVQQAEQIMISSDGTTSEGYSAIWKALDEVENKAKGLKEWLRNASFHHFNQR